MRTYIICLLISIGLPINAQQTISLIDGSIADTVLSTTPTRNVQVVDDGIIVTYNFNNIIIQQDDIYPSASLLSINGFSRNTAATEPALLSRYDSFTVPSGMKASISIIDSSFIELPITISPARPLLRNNGTDRYSTDNIPSISAYHGYFPNSIIWETKQNKYRGNSIENVRVCPMQYNHENNRVRLFKSITYKVLFVESDIKELSTIKPADDYLACRTINGCSISSATFTTNSAEYISDYLIISHPKYETAVNQLAEWKRMLGFNVHTIMKDNWTTTSVKDSVEKIYQGSSSLDYMLIVGDHVDIPAQIKTEYITDLYYCCMDGSSDCTPDIYGGRLIVSTAQEANTIINKIINYEKAPTTDSLFYSNGIHCSHFQDGTEYENNEEDGYEDFRSTLTSENIRDYLMTLNKNIKRVYYTEQTTNPQHWSRILSYGDVIPSELRKPTFRWNGNGDTINAKITAGAFYVLYFGHGNREYWHAPFYSSLYLDNLSNGNKLPVIFSMACQTGNFSYSSCFAKQFLNKSNGGCVALIGSTGNSFIVANDAFAVGMFNAIWPDPGVSVEFFGTGTISPTNSKPLFRIGDIMHHGLSKMEEKFNSEGLKMREMYHCFGDPSMRMYTECPTRFDQICIIRTDEGITVNGGEEDAFITFYNTETKENYTYKGSMANYEGLNDNVCVCIHGNNKIPHIEYQPDIYYYQDEIVDGDDTEADIIRIGSNVTSDITEGPVIFDGAKTTLRSKYVVIKGETTVTKGTELEIISKTE